MKVKVRIRRCKRTKVKCRRAKPATLPEKVIRFAADFFSGTVSGVTTAAILKLLGW